MFYCITPGFHQSTPSHSMSSALTFGQNLYPGVSHWRHALLPTAPLLICGRLVMTMMSFFTPRYIGRPWSTTQHINNAIWEYIRDENVCIPTKHMGLP